MNSKTNLQPKVSPQISEGSERLIQSWVNQLVDIMNLPLFRDNKTVEGMLADIAASINVSGNIDDVACELSDIAKKIDESTVRIGGVLTKISDSLTVIADVMREKRQ